MCGIAGFVSHRDIDIDAMLDSIIHRGPDGRGNYRFKLGQLNAVLGHTRLSIIDLSEAGAQPMFSDDQSVVITFNGEIYNFKELRSRYLQNELFKSSSDTEVLLRLYLKFGISAVKYLNGDFAFSILDKRTNKVYLVRDRVGVKPLYYSLNNGELVFASEIKALLTAGVSRTLNENEIQKYFVFKYTPQQNTLFDSIKKLEPAHILTFDLESKESNISKYWDYSDIELFDDSYAAAKKGLYDLMEDAVRLRLIADVPIGTFLSGGIDSSIVASFLKDRPDIRHYCASKNQDDLAKEGSTSDFYYANKLAQEWGFPLHELKISSSEASLEMIRTTLKYSDDIIADGSQIPSYLITKEASKTSRVILSGMGADEIFLGYAGHQITLLASYFDRLPYFVRRQAGDILAGLNQGKGKFLAYRRYLHKFGKYLDNPSERMIAFNVVGDFQNSLSVFRGGEDVMKEVGDYYFGKSTDFKSLNRFEHENFLVKNLSYMDRMAMANHVEGRVPFLDHRIVEFAHSLPRSFKLSFFGKTKRIVKDTFADVLPSYIVNRRKAGFGMPLRSIFSNEFQSRKMIELDFFESDPRFNIESIQSLCARHWSGQEDNSALIYALITYKEWYKIYISGYGNN
ncbi:MAG: asparagine synthase (glutamine-hydrolyzing) [Flavobacteriales bacterium]|nr:asparagine synthase (glutamine-hydrolyzing) [Flavobacteriales bacterium]